ncbi:protein lin-9 homolog [Drosophila bipectinata]|uniref:protein lin-9 homolog n=1 Tax=Drosophila bipectinata TaxID=42026 RepID=UPI001C89F6DA|nr:protein lin-9 homolog [Drosophila bipectinata]
MSSKRAPETLNSVVKRERCLTPPALAKIGLCTTRRMTQMEAHYQAMPSKMLADRTGEDELFVKRPIYDRVRVKKPSRCHTKAHSEFLPVFPKVEKKDESFYSIPGSKKLHNFLNCLSSHRWIWCEFVESFLDKPIMAIAYDMERFIHECCPMIETRSMPRRGWQLLRRNMGKARRFSPAFIELERQELERSRRMVRELQQCKFNNDEHAPYMEQIPKSVPLPLNIGTKVTSFLEGFYKMGIIDGKVMSYEPQDYSYMVRFDMQGQELVVRLPDYRLHADNNFGGLPLPVLLHAAEGASKAAKNEPSEPIGDNRYSRKLLESLVKVKKLSEIKQKAVMEIAKMNEDYVEGSNQSVYTSTSTRRDIKMTPQRERLQRHYAANMITLHRVNTDVLAPLKILHEHLAAFHKQEQKELGSKCRPAGDIYLKCRNQAEMDIKRAAIEKNLKIESESAQDLVFNLQTLLYVSAELGRENHADMELILKDLVNRVVEHQPPGVGNHFKELWEEMEPLRQRMATTFKLPPKPERIHITQQQQPDQTDGGIFEAVEETMEETVEEEQAPDPMPYDLPEL